MSIFYYSQCFWSKTSASTSFKAIFFVHHDTYEYFELNTVHFSINFQKHFGSVPHLIASDRNLVSSLFLIRLIIFLYFFPYFSFNFGIPTYYRAFAQKINILRREISSVFYDLCIFPMNIQRILLMTKLRLSFTQAFFLIHNKDQSRRVRHESSLVERISQKDI